MKQHITISILAILLFAVSPGIAQNNQEDEVREFEQQFDQNLDELMNAWYLQNMHRFNDSIPPQDIRDTIAITTLPDSVYIKRLKQLPSVIDLNYNDIVRNFIHVYTRDRRERVEIMLGLADYYFPIFERVFDEYELPHEIKYLAVIESALNPRAISRAGATGIWQFMYSTGRMYGLTINTFIDERRDPVKATYAAAEYLKDLYSMFGEWDLAIAAYNCGPGNVRKAIHRTGGKRKYWDIYYYLPRETRGYYPALIAAMYVMNYHEDHNLYPRKISLPLATDTVYVKEQLHLQQVSEVLNIPLKQLQDLNPQYRRNIIPAVNKEFALKLPFKETGDFIQLEDSIYSYKTDDFFKNQVIKSPTRSRYIPQPPPGKTKIYYTVKPGDNLGYIAEWYNVRASDLRYWNNIRGNLIRAGQKLAVFVPDNKTQYYKKVNQLSFEEKQRRIGRPVENNTVSESFEKEEGFIYYKVKFGDTLWEIARKYPGVSEADILQLNQLDNARNLKAGQLLKIKKET
jgi:membrane-bound lytic murein transglycosylase D